MNLLTLTTLLFSCTETLSFMLTPFGSMKKAMKLVRHKTTSLPSMWQTWGSWDENCSVTCGIGFRRRVRECSYKGKDKKRRCKGHRGEMKNFDTKVTCPVDGGWTSWVAWDCSVSCGGGVGVQKRSCTNPVPMFGGKKCEGLGEEDGKCNTQKCADEIYTLSPGTALALKRAMEKINYSFEKREGSNVDLPCDATLVEYIYKEYPGSILFWTKNGQILKLFREKMQVSLTELSIMDLKPEDSGVYLCSMRYVSGAVKPLTIATVAVTPKKANLQVPMNEELILVCSGAQLDKIYKKSFKTWLLDGEVFKEFDNVTTRQRDIYEIKNVSKNMTGTWTCLIADSESGFTWITNVTKVKVVPPIPRYLKLLRNRNFLVILGTSIFLTVVTVGTFFAYKITRAREEFVAEFEMWRHLDINNEYEESGDDSEDYLQVASADEEESLIFH